MNISINIIEFVIGEGNFNNWRYMTNKNIEIVKCIKIVDAKKIFFFLQLILLIQILFSGVNYFKINKTMKMIILINTVPIITYT